MFNHDLEPHPTDIDTVRITLPCVECKKTVGFDMPEEDYFLGMDSRRKGGLMQQCFPNLAPHHRELLTSGICPSCFDRICHD